MADTQEGTLTQELPAEAGPYRLNLEVDIQKVGPCKRHVKVRIPRQDIDFFQNDAIHELVNTAAVPGFRPGHVPRKLVEKRFKKEVGDQVKQKVLMQSLERLGDEHQLDAIAEPDFDVENLTLPDEGDFSYEFDVEVRPEFDLPDYATLELERPLHAVTESDVVQYRSRFLSEMGTLEEISEPAAAGDYVTVDVTFRHGDRILSRLDDSTLRLRPTLRFYDAELAGFDTLLAGARPGDVRTGQVTVSTESPKVELRGEPVDVTFEVRAVKRMKLPELTPEFLATVGVDTPEDLDETIKGIIERQVTYNQRQETRRQLIDKMTEAASWDLPENLVRRQVENALRREVLEMQQAGFTDAQIRAREGELRQQSVTNTHQALKEHFVLDKIAREEKITVSDDDIETEIYMMATQRGESPRKMRARLEKSGMIDNLTAQITERKAVDVVLERVKFKDVEMAWDDPDRIEAARHAVCGSEAPTTTLAAEE